MKRLSREGYVPPSLDRSLADGRGSDSHKPARSSTWSPLGPTFWLLLYLGFVLIRPHEYVESLAAVPVLPMLLVIALMSWLLTGPRRFDAPQFGAGLGMLLMAPVSVAASGWIGGSIPTFLDFAPVLLFSMMVASTADSIARLRAYMFTVLGCAVVIAVHGVEQSGLGVGWSGASLIQGRITYLGFMNDPNDLARLFVIAVPFTVYFAARPKGPSTRLVAIAALPLLVYGIVLTNSRGAFLALMGMLAILAVRRWGWLRGALAGGAGTGALLAIAPSRMDDLSADEESAAGRIEAWYEGFRMFIENPLFGVGKGGFIDHHELTAHNSFVQVYAEMGIAGYFFWFAIVFTTLLATLEVSKVVSRRDLLTDASLERSDYEAMGRALYNAYVGLMITSMFLSRAYEFTMYVLVALVVAFYLNSRRLWPQIRRIRLRELAFINLALALASIVFLWLVTRVLLQFG